MGKIFSKPKMPSAPVLPTIIDTPAPTVTPAQTVTANDPPAGSGGDNADDAPEVTPEEQRVQNILTRNRGRVGTIATSFNGILSDAVTTIPARKTLLGE